MKVIGNVELSTSVIVRQEPEGKVGLLIGDTVILLNAAKKYLFGMILDLEDEQLVLHDRGDNIIHNVKYVDIVRVVERRDRLYERV